MTTTQIQTREAWLHKAIEIFRLRFEGVGMPLPEKIHVSVGFGFGTRAESKEILGQTWTTFASDDNVNHVFVSPEVGDTAKILATLLHELIHVADNNQNGHKGPFAEAAVRFGFEGSLLEIHPSMDLGAEMMCMAETLGEYPHGALSAASRMRTGQPVPVPVGPGAKTPRLSSGPAKQGTRMIKLSCASHGCECGGYTVRTTERWIAVGMPMCPAGAFMERD